MTVPEVRRLVWQLVWHTVPTTDAVLTWSTWRRRHQLRAKRCHYQTRRARLSAQLRL